MKLLRAFALCSFLLWACSPTSSPTSLPPSVLPLDSTATPTSVPNTPTPLPIETATKTPGPVSIIPSCTNVEVQEALPADYQIPGVMLSLDRPSFSSSTGRADYKESSLYRFDLVSRAETFLVKPEDYQDKIKTKIMRLGMEDLSVSPDFQKAVYIVDAYVESNGKLESHGWKSTMPIQMNEKIFPGRMSGIILLVG